MPDCPQCGVELTMRVTLRRFAEGECIRPGTAIVVGPCTASGGYVEHYNNVRLNSAVGYITPADMLAGRQQETMPSGIGSWRRPGNNGGFVASKPLGAWFALWGCADFQTSIWRPTSRDT